MRLLFFVQYVVILRTRQRLVNTEKVQHMLATSGAIDVVVLMATKSIQRTQSTVSYMASKCQGSLFWLFFFFLLMNLEDDTKRWSDQIDIFINCLFQSSEPNRGVERDPTSCTVCHSGGQMSLLL